MARGEESHETSVDAQGRRQWGRRAAGILFRSEDGRYFLTFRSPEVAEPNVWGIPGGRVEEGETPQAAAIAEAKEELGSLPPYRIVDQDVYKSGDFEYTTFLAEVSEQDAAAWKPRLNWENTESGWWDDPKMLIEEVHPNVLRVVDLWTEKSRVTPFDELMSRLQKIPQSVIKKEIRSNDFWDDWVDLVREHEPRISKARAMSDWIDERWDRFIDDLRNAEFLGDQLVIYRCISVKSPGAFRDMLMQGDTSPKYPGLGIYWSWDPGKAECYWGQHDKDVFVRAMVDLDSVDIKSTLLSNFTPSTGPDEYEIRLFENKPVDLLGVGIPPQRGATPVWMDVNPSITMKS